MKHSMQIGAFVLSLSFSLQCSAMVVASGAGGFVVREEVAFPGEPPAAWQRLIRPQDWWSPQHTYSQDAANLSLALRPGGCWCEKLAGDGFVRHMEVVFVQPGAILRLVGGLGPLQGIGASGALTFTLKPGPPGTTKVVAEYAVTGYLADGFEKLAVAVDEVLGEQLKRFAASP